MQGLRLFLTYRYLLGSLPRERPDKTILVRSHHLAQVIYAGQPLRADSIAISQTNIPNAKSCQELLRTQFLESPSRLLVTAGQS